LGRRRGHRLAGLDHGDDAGAVGDAGGKANAGDQRREDERHYHHLQVGHAVGGKQREIVHDTLPIDVPVISRGEPAEGSCRWHPRRDHSRDFPEQRVVASPGPWRSAIRTAVASRWPYRECLRAASWRRSTSFGVRYSRSRRSELRGRRGVTVRFTMVEGWDRVLRFFMTNAPDRKKTFRITTFCGKMSNRA